MSFIQRRCRLPANIERPAAHSAPAEIGLPDQRSAAKNCGATNRSVEALQALENFEEGDRVRLSELGRAAMSRRLVEEGTVISVISALRVSVLFDGRKTRVTIFRSYLTRA